VPFRAVSAGLCQLYDSLSNRKAHPRLSPLLQQSTESFPALFWFEIAPQLTGQDI
jgi:hypothetical protein